MRYVDVLRWGFLFVLRLLNVLRRSFSVGFVFLCWVYIFVLRRCFCVGFIQLRCVDDFVLRLSRFGHRTYALFVSYI